MSIIRQNFSPHCEEAINDQINLELYASYMYLAMAYHFDRPDVALPGISGYFKRASDDEREHAMKLLTYQNKRGGQIVLNNIVAPEKGDWSTAKDAMLEALSLEQRVNEALLELHVLASESNDANLQDFLETEFLQEQIDSIKEIGDHVTNLERVGDGLGVYVFDQRFNHKD